MGIAISTLGFLSQSILVAPRVYYAMAEDGLFFKSVAKLHPTYRVPVLAIILQGIFAIIITLSGQYEEILNYVVLDDFVFFGLTAYCVFIFRKQEKATGQSSESSFRALGHPITTGLFILVCIAIVANTLYTSPLYGTLSVVVILSGIPIYYFWRWLNKRKD
jgi:APA family basic amino acid/polyamine antiporter